MKLPRPIALAKSAGLAVFGTPYSANLIVIRGPGEPGEWDGLLTLSWVETPGGVWRTVSAPCATRPGPPYLANPINPGGTAMLALGQNRASHTRGFHHAGQPNASPAFVQVGTVRVHRDIQPGDYAHTPGPVVSDASAVNIHRVKSPRELAGCIGVEAGPLAEVLDAFDRLAAKYPQPRVSLSVVADGGL